MIVAFVCIGRFNELQDSFNDINRQTKYNLRFWLIHFILISENVE